MRVTIHVYYSASEADAFIAAHTAGGSLVYSRGTGTGFTTITGGTLANPSLRPRIVAWPQKGKLFCFDGTNPVTEYNGVDMQTTPTRKDDLGIYEYIPPRRGPYACLHKNRIFATDPGELAFSVYACDVNDETTWRPQVQLAANDERGGAITGLASYGDALIIFKNTCLFRFLGDPEFGAAQLSRYSEVGCVAPDSIQVTPFGVIFVGREGVWLTDGENVTLLSRAIRPLFVGRDSETLHTDAVGVYYPRREQYWLKLSPASDGYVLQRVAILTEGGETTQLAWSRIPSLNMNCGAVWGSAADDGQLYLGDQIGFVWLRDVGADDNGSSYTTGILTSQRYVHERRLEGRINRLKPLYRGAAPLTGAVRYDQAATDDVAFTAGATLASPAVQEPRTYLADQASFGRFISVRCESSEGPEFELHRIDADTRVRGGRAWG